MHTRFDESCNEVKFGSQRLPGTIRKGKTWGWRWRQHQPGAYLLHLSEARDAAGHFTGVGRTHICVLLLCLVEQRDVKALNRGGHLSPAAAAAAAPITPPDV